MSSRVRLKPDTYDSTTHLVFDKLGVAGAERDSLFLQQVGIPLTVALSLLRDVTGKITLAVPVSGDRHGTRVGLGEIIGQAIVKAILGAVASPLKMLGAVGDLMAGGGSVLPEPIPCTPGVPIVDAAGEHRRLLERAEALKTALFTEQGTDPGRVAIGDSEVDREKGKPAVRIAFGG